MSHFVICGQGMGKKMVNNICGNFFYKFNERIKFFQYFSNFLIALINNSKIIFQKFRISEINEFLSFNSFPK